MINQRVPLVLTYNPSLEKISGIVRHGEGPVVRQPIKTVGLKWQVSQKDRFCRDLHLIASESENILNH